MNTSEKELERYVQEYIQNKSGELEMVDIYCSSLWGEGELNVYIIYSSSFTITSCLSS